MKYDRFPFPVKYWVYAALVFVLGILLFVNIFVTSELTGDKEFLDFTQQNWQYFVLSMLVECILGLLLFFFAFKARKLSVTRQKLIEQYYEESKFAGMKPGDVDYIWFDFNGDERAKIVKLGDVYYLYVENYDWKTESWTPINTVSVFDSLGEIKKALFYDFDFYCEENTVLDQHGNEVFRDDN